MMGRRLAFLLAVMALWEGCTTPLPAIPEAADAPDRVAVGRAVAIITGERGRKFEPEIRSLEIVNRETKERFRVDIKSDDERFVLPLAPGDYELNRVQISEGPFLSIAQLASVFSIPSDPITYVGTWRFGIDSPKYGRMVSVSMVDDEDDRAEAVHSLTQQYPSLNEGRVATVLPDPSGVQVRLYEVAPYPRYPRYFRRHWW